MSRSTSYYGLPAKATKFLQENVETYTHKFNGVYGEGSAVKAVEKKIGVCGMCDEHDIVKYKLKDNPILYSSKWAEEFVQETIFDSGPCIFVGLKVGGKSFLWTRKQIEKKMGYEISWNNEYVNFKQKDTE